MIDNFPDAITKVVDDMKITYTSTSISTTTTTTTINYLSGENQLRAGMYVEFPDFYENKRFQIATFTENSVGDYTFTINSVLSFKDEIPKFNLFLNFYYGHPKDIQKDVIDLVRNPNRKQHQTPLLAMFHNIQEKRGNSTDYISEGSVNFALIIDAQTKWYPDERLSNSFKKCLHPLYDAFILAIKRAGLFSMEPDVEIQHDYSDIYYYSASDAAEQNTLAIVADAIEINNMQLTLFKNNLNL